LVDKGYFNARKKLSIDPFIINAAEDIEAKIMKFSSGKARIYILIVYSSSPHVSYISAVLEVINSVLRSMDIEPYYLRDQIRGGRLYPLALQEMITQSDMGIPKELYYYVYR